MEATVCHEYCRRNPAREVRSDICVGVTENRTRELRTESVPLDWRIRQGRGLAPLAKKKKKRSAGGIRTGSRESPSRGTAPKGARLEHPSFNRVPRVAPTPTDADHPPPWPTDLHTSFSGKAARSHQCGVFHPFVDLRDQCNEDRIQAVAGHLLAEQREQ